MDIKIIPINSIAFYVTDNNQIERVTIKSFTFDSDGRKYEIEREGGKIQIVSYSKIYEIPEDIKSTDFNDFFYLTPILESNGLDGRGFPWASMIYKYFAIYKVVKILDFPLYNKNTVKVNFECIPFGIIETKHLKDLNIKISNIKENSYFLEEDMVHYNAIVQFIMNLKLLFKKITYNYVNMNTTSCELTGGGGFAFNPNLKNTFKDVIPYNLDIEKLILRSKLETDKIFPTIYNFNGYAFNSFIVNKDNDYAVGYTKDTESRIKVITKDKSVIPNEIEYKKIKKIKCIFEKEGEFEILKDSVLLPSLTVWGVKYIDANYGLDIINKLITGENESERKNNTNY